MRALRRWSLLLVPGGFVAGHELGYQAASALGSAAPTGGHGYLAATLLVGMPFAFAALARTFLAGYRAQLPPVRWRSLAGAQVALFLAVELAEHAALGLSPAATLTEPAVVAGLGAQLAVSALLVLVVRTTHDVGVAVAVAVGRSGRRFPSAPRPPWRPAGAVPVVAAAATSPVGTRGPPPPRTAPA